jgi:hypothetical protein
MHAEFFRARMKVQWDEGGGRILLGDNRRRGGNAVADQVPVCWSLDLAGVPSVSIWPHVYSPPVKLVPGVQRPGRGCEYVVPAKACHGLTFTVRIAPTFWYVASMVVGIVTLHGLDGPRIQSRWGRDFPHPSRLAVGPTLLPVQWIPGLFPEGKASGAWCCHLPPSSVEVKDRVEPYLYSASGCSFYFYVPACNCCLNRQQREEPAFEFRQLQVLLDKYLYKTFLIQLLDLQLRLPELMLCDFSGTERRRC